jgi:hypothetical protein
VVSFFVSCFAAFTALPFYAHDVQRVADNTVTTTIAYLIALTALLLLNKVFLGFTSSPVDKPIKRWVIVAEPAPKPGASESGEQKSAIPVESERREPAA